MQSKLERLNTIVTPLMSITDLSLAKKRLDQSNQFSNDGSSRLGEGVNVNMLTQEERLRELEQMNPQIILQNLADFCNTQEMPKQRVLHLERRFATKDDVQKLKHEISQDEARVKQHEEMQKQMRNLATKINDIETSLGQIDTDNGSLRQELRSKASTIKTEQIEMQMMDCATKNDFGKIINKLEAYTTLESFNKMRINAEREHAELD